MPVPAQPRASTDDLTARVLNEMQSRFPLVLRPYEEIGDRLGLSERAAFARATEAREAGLIRQVSAIFDTRAIGYSSTLAAMRVPEERLERAVAVVNAHPGVSHNYLREHAFNLWFTLALPPGTLTAEVLAVLRDLCEAEACRSLPTIQLFKVGVAFDMTGSRHSPQAQLRYSQEDQDRALKLGLSSRDIEFVCAAQRDWSTARLPYHAIADDLGWQVEDVLTRARALCTSGHLRRFAALLHHRRAGFSANGMSVWAVAPGEIERVGALFASHASVSHCYQRPTYPDWPFSVFAMVHGRSRTEVDRTVAELSSGSGIATYEVLYSTAEFKKARVTYFAPEHARWRERCAAALREHRAAVAG